MKWWDVIHFLEFIAQSKENTAQAQRLKEQKLCSRDPPAPEWEREVSCSHRMYQEALATAGSDIPTQDYLSTASFSIYISQVVSTLKKHIKIKFSNWVLWDSGIVTVNLCHSSIPQKCSMSEDCLTVKHIFKSLSIITKEKNSLIHKILPPTMDWSISYSFMLLKHFSWWVPYLHANIFLPVHHCPW